MFFLQYKLTGGYDYACGGSGEGEHGPKALACPFFLLRVELFTCLWLSPSALLEGRPLNTGTTKSLKGVLPEGNFHLLRAAIIQVLKISGLPKGFQVEASARAVTIAGPRLRKGRRMRPYHKEIADRLNALSIGRCPNRCWPRVLLAT